MTGRPRVDPAARRRVRFRPSAERLEPRSLCAVAGTPPTDAEQYMLELVNRARANPAVEGQRLLALAQSDPVLRRATGGWDLDHFYRVISSYAPSPPLAFNPRLIDAALAEDASMLAANSQHHSPPGFLNNPSVAVAVDGKAYYPTGSGWWSTGENIFAFSANVTGTSLTSYVDYFEAGFLLDWGNADFGHLRNILAPGPAEANTSAGIFPFSEVGIGLITGVTPNVPPDANPSNAGNAGLNVGPAIVTQEFGWHSGNAFLTGAFYVDAPGSHFYAPGEGLGGLSITAVGTAGQGTFRTQTWATGGYSLQLPPGTYQVTAAGNIPGGAPSTVVTIGLDNVGWGAGVSPSLADIPVPADYDGVGHAEFAAYRPSTGVWTIANPAGGTRSVTLGQPGDIPVPGHYDGGRSEPAVYHPADATWTILGPAGKRLIQWGIPGDIPVPGDYDGDGKTDLAVFRPSTAVWFVWNSRTNTFRIMQWGQPGLDQPVPAAYDGGGVAEIAVLRPTTFQWFIMGKTGIRVTQFGCPGCVPIPGDYDGVGRAELAVFLPINAGFYVLSGPGYCRTTFYGVVGVDQPVSADFDGDGKLDVAVVRPRSAEWFVMGSRGGWIYGVAGRAGITQTLRGLAAAASPIPAAWADWVGSPGAGEAEGFGTVRPTTMRPPIPARAVVTAPRRPRLAAITASATEGR